MLLLGTFAGLALALAVVGVYGVVSYSVRQRAQEMGVRLALGARPPMIISQVVGNATRLAAIGVVCGIVAAALTTRFQSSLLFGVSPLDPATYAIVAALMLGVASAAAFVPGVRASRTDPINVLREE